MSVATMNPPLKLPKGCRKLIFVSRRAIEENRARRAAGERANFAPVWCIFVFDDSTNTYSFYAGHSWRAKEVYPVVGERPRWMPTVRPDDPREPIHDLSAWVETTGELTVFDADATNSLE
jgi:hypothetical protein